MNPDDKEVDRARGIGISSSESEPDSETDDEAQNEAEEEEDIYDKDNPRRSGKITSNLEWDRFGWFIREIGPPTHFLSR